MLPSACPRRPARAAARRLASVAARAPPRAGVARRLARAAAFWACVVSVWGKYKTTQARVALGRRRKGKEWADEVWRKRHEEAGDEMWELCSELRAFYAKVGQLIAMQAFVPEVIRRKLSRLQDDMPPLGAGEVRGIVEAELGRGVGEVFERLELGEALGCASIAQVHWGVLKDGKETEVAVKVQMPQAAALMKADLGGFRVLARLLEKTELKFDLVRPVDELEAQLSAEFDFRREATAMRKIHGMLARVRGVRVPLPVEGLVTPRLLVMEYLDGVPLSRLEGRVAGRRAMRRVGRAIMKRMGEAYGEMILGEGYWQADPHPGNILLLNRKLDIGLIDYGQTKSISNEQRLAFAKLVDAMARRHPPSVAEGMKSMGIVVEDLPSGNKKQAAKERREAKRAARKLKIEAKAKAREEAKAAAQRKRAFRSLPQNVAEPIVMQGGAVALPGQSKPLVLPAHAAAAVAPNPAAVAASAVESAGEEPAVEAPASRKSRSKLTSAEKLAYTMFDTAEYAGVSSNPFSDESALRSATVTELPQELFFLLRTMQIMRGICHATGNDNFSIVKSWAPLARGALQAARG